MGQLLTRRASSINSETQARNVTRATTIAYIREDVHHGMGCMRGKKILGSSLQTLSQIDDWFPAQASQTRGIKQLSRCSIRFAAIKYDVTFIAHHFGDLYR